MTAAKRPPSRRSAWFLLSFAMAYAGGVVAYLPLLSLLLPIQVVDIAGEAKVGVMTACVIAGALAASASNILFGMLSDRSLARGGGRRRWLAAGVVLLLLSYGGVAQAGSPMAIVVAVAGFQFAVNALLAPLMAIMADEVPDAQKGIAGGLLALGAPAASALGAFILTVDALNQTERLAIVPLVSAACIVPLLLIADRRSAAAEVASAPIPRRELVVASIARLVVQVAGNALSLYVFYYFQSIAPDLAPRVLGASVGRLLTIATLVSLPVALIAGRLSDRTGKRKAALIGAAILAAFGLLGMGLAASWAAGAIAFAVYMIGSSVFLALHSTFAMQLLPSARHRGRDLGLLNLTNTLPALAGPLLTWALATPGDFAPVLFTLAILTFAGGLVMAGVRGRV